MLLSVDMSRMGSGVHSTGYKAVNHLFKARG